MFGFDRHRRVRHQLSVYIDGELSLAQTQALEAHLDSCPDCRLQLDQLRATVFALRELPQAEVPRSFALTPEQAARPVPRPPLSSLPPLSTGLRLAGAAVAVALASVLVVDVGDLGGGGGRESAPPAAEIAMFDAASDRAAEEGAPEIAAEPAPVAEPSVTQIPSDEEGGIAGGVGGGPGMGGGTGGSSTEETPPSPARTPSAPIPTAEASEPFGLVVPPETEAPAGQPSLAPEDGGGLDPLRAAEIGLAAALGLVIAGSVALAYAGRKR